MTPWYPIGLVCKAAQRLGSARNLPRPSHQLLRTILPAHPVWTFVRAFSPSAPQFKKKKKLIIVPPLDEADLDEQFVRGSGPGGQAVNKTNNAVCLIHRPTGIRVQAHTHRSREANRNQARSTLAVRVDYILNKGRSQIEKMWKRKQAQKLAKIRKQKRKEKEALYELKGLHKKHKKSIIKAAHQATHPTMPRPPGSSPAHQMSSSHPSRPQPTGSPPAHQAPMSSSHPSRPQPPGSPPAPIDRLR